MRLIYSSNRTDSSEQTVEDVLRQSDRNNSRDDITGALITGKRHFMQLLEGERYNVSRCFSRIMRDDRHKNVHLIGSSTIEHRLFERFSMCRIDLEAVDWSILYLYQINERFAPELMSQAAVEDFFQVLSTNILQVVSQSDASSPGSLAGSS